MAYFQYYVYTLAYPDGRIFYIGKGQGDRILQHEKEAEYYHTPQGKKNERLSAIREIWASGGKVVKTKVFETENEEEAYKYEKQFIAQCDSAFLTNRTKGGGPQFSKQDPYARLKHRDYYYSPHEACERLGVSQDVWHRLFLSGVLHFYQAEGCTLLVLQRKEIDDFAAQIKNGTYPLDAWEMVAPNAWKGKTLEKRSPWWDDEPSPHQREGQHSMSKIEMQREAITTALDAAHQAFSQSCYLIGSYELDQQEQSERAWNIGIRVGQKQYTYIVELQQNHLVISDAPTKPHPHEEKHEEITLLSERNDPHEDEVFPSLDRTTPKDIVSRQPDISAVPQPTDEPITLIGALKLTIAQVQARWEAVLRRMKSKKDGAKIAALLRGYNIVGVNANGDIPVVMLKASTLFHYTAIQKGSYQLSIEWVLKIELEQECRLCLLPPDDSIP